MSMLTEAERRALSGPVFFHALRAALARPPVWMASWALLALLALVGTLPWLRFFEDALASWKPGSEVGSLSAVFRFDHRDDFAAVGAASRGVGAVLALLAMLVGAFSAGGWLQVILERTEGHSLRRFFFGGARFFWRFARVLVLTILALGIGAWVIYGKPWELVVEGFLLSIGDREELVSEWSAVRVAWFQHGTFAAWMAIVVLWGDYVRARLALHEARSAVWAGLCAAITLARHPVQVARPAALLFGCEWVMLWFLGIWVDGLNTSMGAESGARHVWMLLVLVQLAALWRAVVRGAHINAAVRVSRQVIDPPAKPDPWRNRVGGPGGPQYPIGGDDYGVSI